MNLQLSYIDEKCKPDGEASGLFLKALDIIAYENLIGKVIKSKDMLGVISYPLKNAEGVETIMTKDKLFPLDTLYRCIIDTGVEVPDTAKFSIEVQPLTSLAIQKGIIVVPSVFPILKEDKRYIGVILINTATYKFPIKQFDVIARLKVTIKDHIIVCHQEPKLEQPSN